MKDIKELFEESRRADRAATPSFRSMTSGGRKAPNLIGWRIGVLAVATATAAGALALALFTLPRLEQETPLQVRLDTAPPEPAPVVAMAEPPADPEPEVVPPEPDVAVKTKKYVPPQAPSRQIKMPPPSPPAPIVPSVEFLAALDTTSPDAAVEKTVSADGDGAPTVHGSRSRDFRSVVSGVSNVDPLTGQWMSRVNPNSIAKMEVITAGAGVEFGRAQGGFARVGGVHSQWAEADTEERFSTESYNPIHESGFVAVADEPLSTFSIDVDTASYSNVRRFLQNGELPPADAVRIEELINYFSYDDPAPTGDEPFSVNVEVAGCPWNGEHRLARIGLKGRENDRSVGSNLVFLIDVSGSMQPANKLPLLKSALRLLVDQLDGRDQVAIVVYAGASGLVLSPTSGDGKQEILEALGNLQAGGSTNGGAGLSLAYKLAGENFIPGGVNRVILATDGDFNVGMTNRGSLVRRIRKDAERGIFLTTLGFGMGNLKDETLETLADKGNGNYAYIDSLAEARKVLVEEIGGTLVTIAKDVKIQVEFNPLQVGAYRLIGYENRMLNKEDFNDDRKDAGEIGAGHSVSALYEIVPPGMPESRAAVDQLRYQQPQLPDESAESGEMFTLKLRYKEPEGKSSLLLSFPVVDEGLDTAQASPDFKFASAVAAFGMLLRDSSYAGDAGFESIRRLGLAGRDHDEAGYRAGFIDLVNRAEELQAAP